MIRLTTFKNKENYVGFRIEGHARYSKHGSDIVCAAVSILSQTCVNAIESILHMDIDFEEEEKRGMVKLMLTDFNAEGAKEASLLIESMELGIKGVSELYPKYVKVNSREVSP